MGERQKTHSHDLKGIALFGEHVKGSVLHSFFNIFPLNISRVFQGGHVWPSLRKGGGGKPTLILLWNCMWELFFVVIHTKYI